MEKSVKKAYIMALEKQIREKQERIDNLGIHFDEVMLSMTLQAQIESHKNELKRVQNTDY